METMSSKKGTPKQTPTAYRGPSTPSPLITQFEYKLLWVLLDTAIDGGAYDHDEDIKADHQEVREKLRIRAAIK